ncbi:MAG: hypothetical protein NTZ05_02580 [Chloroflexi bacterium]|nr:hypothetical protein [Chloroflexota bacterium]
MTAPNEPLSRLSIDVAPELRRLAAEEQDGNAAERADWSRLSEGAFLRDWDSEEDEAYDRLA